MSETPEQREARQDEEINQLEYEAGIKQVPGYENPPIKPPQPPIPTPTPTGEIKIIAATGSTDDGNVPANAIDNNPATRFSSLGIDSFLKLDLGSVQEIDKIDFMWYDKPPRSFDVSVILEGGATPQTLSHNATASTSTLPVPSIAAKTITIKLVNTSNPTKWLSIVNVKVFGKGSTPIDHTCPPKQHWDDALGKCVDDVIPPGNNLDHFGTALGYARDTSKPLNNWYMTGASDPRFMESNPKALSNGWFTYQSLGQGRIEVMSVPGLTEDSFDTFYIDDIIKKGYAYKPIDSPDGKGDFGNVEVNIKYQNISEGSGSFEAHPETVYALFRQTNDTKKVGKDKRVIAQCEAGSLHSNIYKARSKFEKDAKHTEGYTAHDPEAKNGYGSLGQTGFVHKSVFYRVPNNTIPGGYAMKCEQYISTDGLAGKKFKLLIEYLDDGHWGPSKGGHNSECGCSEYVVLNFGRPTIGIRIDFMKSFEFKDWSITSIDPSKRLI
jgi:hypothetical protein